MGNHFHLLASVPHRPSWIARFDGPDGEQRLLSHLRTLYSKAYIDHLQAELTEWRRLGKKDQPDSARIDVVRTMAAYIDLNPVRAGLVQDPADYPWCGYAEATAGKRHAQRGLCRIMQKPVDSWDTHQVAQTYATLLNSTPKSTSQKQKPTPKPPPNPTPNPPPNPPSNPASTPAKKSPSPTSSTNASACSAKPSS